MKLILSIAAAAGLAALGGCSEANQDNAATTVDANSEEPAGESVLPVDDNAAGTDTLGNQLNQLNDSGNAEESANSDAGSESNSS